MEKNYKLDLLMASLNTFYKDRPECIDEINSIITQKSQISLRILDWFVTNYAKKYKTVINDNIDVYINYKLMLKSFSKSNFDPFCRKNKIIFEYREKVIETSCGQLCFFRWCFQNDILKYVYLNFAEIDNDMKSCFKNKKSGENSEESVKSTRSITKQNKKFIVCFD